MAKTLWPLDEQTMGKHLVLRHYLNGWFPILSRWNGRLLFIDGFAGPGEYENGQEGSPPWIVSGSTSARDEWETSPSGSYSWSPAALELDTFRVSYTAKSPYRTRASMCWKASSTNT